MHADKRLQLLGLRDLACAACHPHPHSLHVDANMKVYVWDRHRQTWRAPYFDGLLFQPSADMQDHMDTLDRLLGRAKVCPCAQHCLHCPLP